MSLRYLYAAMISLAVITVAYSGLDMRYDFSYRFVVWDSLEHFIGGLTVGFFALFFAELFNIRRQFVPVFLAVVGVGVAWEIMEYVSYLTDSPFMSYEMDTIKDLILDCAGGYTAIIIGKHLKRI